MGFVRKTTEVKYHFSPKNRGYTHYQHDLSLLVLTLVNWLMQGLSDFSTVFFFSLSIVNSVEKIHFVQPALKK